MNKWLRQLFCIVSLFALCILPVSAYVEIVEQDDRYFVTDEAKILDAATEEYIVSKNQILNQTSGASIVVVTVKLLRADIVDYAYTLFNEWQLGDDTLNNGILLLISTADEDYYCMVGRGLESRLSSDELQEILDEKLEPDFAIGNYQVGIRKVFDELYKTCVELYHVDEEISNSKGSNQVFASIAKVFTVFKVIMIIFLVISMMLILFSLLSNDRKYRRTTYRRGMVPPPPPPRTIRPTPVYRPYRSTHSTYRSSSHRTRSSSFGSSSSRSFSSRPTSTRSSSTFKVRSGGSTRGAGAGRRK